MQLWSSGKAAYKYHSLGQLVMVSGPNEMSPKLNSIRKRRRR